MRGEILVVFSLCAGNIENYLFREDTRGAMSRERGYRRKILLHCICMRKKNRTINFTDLSAVIAWLYFVSAKMRLHFSFYFQLFKPFFIIRKFKGRFAVHIMVYLIFLSVD
ncbi:unknown [Coraliomargarita sp. CAG:312]|nr:unknown [Coraliomargarita sp. CAG:312]